jgi:hypothetical protein
MDLKLWEKSYDEKKKKIVVNDNTNIFEDVQKKGVENTNMDFNNPKNSSESNIQKKIAFLSQSNVTKQIICEKKGRVVSKMKVIFAHCKYDITRNEMYLIGTVFERDF